MGKGSEKFIGYSQGEAISLLSNLHDEALHNGLVGHGVMAPFPNEPTRYQVWFESGHKVQPIPEEVKKSI